LNNKDIVVRVIFLPETGLFLKTRQTYLDGSSTGILNAQKIC